MPGEAVEGDLQRLAELYGVQAVYRDATGQLRRVEQEALVAVLQARGAPVDKGPRTWKQAIATRERELQSRMLEPVVIAWEGEPLLVDIRIGDAPAAPVVIDLLPEADGEQRTWRLPASELTLQASGSHRAVLAESPGLGYHRLRVKHEGREAEALLVVAPREAYRDPVPGRGWALFAPLYGLRSDDDWGAGDLSELEDLLGLVRATGGEAVGTLPMLAAYLEEPFDPSPYSPVSRLFWNEMYLDVSCAPEVDRCAGARQMLDSTALAQELRELRRLTQVDYRRVMRAKRAVLTELARCFFSDPLPMRMEPFLSYLRDFPEAEDYAAFRAAVDRRRAAWTEWPLPLRDGGLTAADYDESDRRYHLYSQFLLEEQLRRIAGAGGDTDRDAGLYLDLPLGVNPGGYDTWRQRRSFAEGASAGAPPDPFFVKGQDWGFPPLHPETLREDDYAYLRASLRTHMAHARYLRIDHVMGLHRLFWVPRGFEAKQGAYVRYPAEELYAILCLESVRNRCGLVGEDLGTVPPEVRPALRAHGVRRMFVLQYEVEPGMTVMPPVPSASVASLNTHDMPPFAAFLEGSDIDERIELGHLEKASRRDEHGQRRSLVAALTAALDPSGGSGNESPLDPPALLRGSLEYLGNSAADLVLVNLEDLWLETDGQNMPGTEQERPNWRRKLAATIQEVEQMADVRETLSSLSSAREGARAAGSAARAAGAPRPLREHSLLSDEDIYLFNEGSHLRLYEHLGSRPLVLDGEEGAHFSVWAPNAEAVSVIGDFNGWDPRGHLLRPRASSGIWEGFVPGLGRGALYKYHIVSHHGSYRVDKADPFAWHHEKPPKTGSVLWDLAYRWGDDDWMNARGSRNRSTAPQSVYEVHLGSWMRDPDNPREPLSYRDIAPRLADYVADMGFTHVELLPIMEHPFYGSWGYQTTGYFAASSRYGTPQDLMFLIDHLHQRGIGVILDWVPSHFPSDEHGLAYFDGTHLFEHSDPRQGFHPDWRSYIFNYGRHEVRSFLLSSAMFWLDKYHADGLRVDAVASMLYLDYSRQPGEWIPNKYGGRENLEAIQFLRRLNIEVYRHYPDVQTVAEESTSWPMVSRPTHLGGLGFGLKWDMGWMHDTLQYMAHDPVHRRFHHDGLTFRMIYAFTENFVLPLSHDEVVHGKGSLLGKMPGDDWQKFANLRLLFTYMFGSAGKKLLFMGGELAPWREWGHEESLDWHLLQYPPHAGVQRLVRQLNRLYRGEPALHELDLEPEGFEWVAANDSEQSVISFLRRGRSSEDLLLFVFNFTPVPRHNYLVGVPRAGIWEEIFNSDAADYGGSGQGNFGGVEAAPLTCHGRSHCLALTLPPLAGVILRSPA